MAISLGTCDGGERQSAEMEAFANRRAGEQIVVADTWDTLGLHEKGFSPSPYGAINEWFWRPAGPIATTPAAPPGFLIEEVSDPAGLGDYERVSLRGFGSEERLGQLGPFGVHAVGILDDPRMRIFVGRVNGEPVTGAMAYVSDDVVGIYDVATPPEHRRRGYGEAITKAAIAAGQDVPAWLDPSDMALPMYRRIGFEPIGRYTAWLRPDAE
jgi:GNAT superfamily N-acetyltransferase